MNKLGHVDPSPDEQTIRSQVLPHYLNISNNDSGRIALKRIGLKSLGWSEEEIELECTPKEISREEVLQAVGEMAAREQRKLRREYLKEKRSRKSLEGIS
jgi:hypothetical protein